MVGTLIRGCRGASCFDLFALPKCVHLPYLRHVSLITKIYGLLQLIICTLHNYAICIDSYSPINKFYSFIFFSLLINAVIFLLNCLVLVLFLCIHFLSLRCYCIPGRKPGILRIQYGHVAAAEISFGRDNLKNILGYTFQIWYVGIYGQCHERYCFVTLTFNFKVTGGLLKVRFWPFFSHFGPVLIYRKLDHPMAGIYNSGRKIKYIYIYMSSVSMQKFDLEALH